MKTMKCLLLGLVLFSPAFMFAQKKTSNNAKIQVKAELLSSVDISFRPVKPAFEVDIAQTFCTRNGVSLTAITNGGKRKYTYAFLWVLDGTLVSRSSRVDCVTGRSATLYVTRSDGARASKTIPLNNGHDAVSLENNLDIK